MDLPDRRRFILGFLLVGVLVLWWATRSQNASDTPAGSGEPAATTATAPAIQSPAPTNAEPDVAPNTVQASAVFGSFRGRVIDAATGTPVRAFEVQFRGARSSAAVSAAPGARKFESADGRFEWGQLPPAIWEVGISAPGFQRFELVDLRIEEGAATPEIVLPLLRGHEVRGRVYDEVSGHGIDAATIGFRESGTGRFEGGWRTRSRATSASDGSFVLDGVPPGRMTLDVSARDYAQRQIDVAVNRETPQVDIALSTGGAITGRLTAADGVTPVTGYVGLWDVDDHFGGKSMIGETGEFRFEHLSPGPYQVTGEIEGRQAVTQKFVLAKNQRIEGVVLALVEGRRIRGTVAGLRPEDLRKVGISAQRDGQDGGMSHVRVDPEGAFELRGVQAGRVVLVVTAPGRQLSKTVDMPADADITVNLEFPAGVRLSGRVTRGGRPLGGTVVVPRAAVKQPGVYSHPTLTSRDGEYALEGLAPGEYTLWVEGYKTAPMQVSRDTVFDIDVPLPQFSGRVLEAEGAVPIVGAYVRLWPAEATSSASSLNTSSDHFGQFSLFGLERGDYMLTAYRPGYEPYRKRISYSSPATEMTIRLRQDAGVEIRVRGAAGSEPLKEVLVLEVIGGPGGSWMRLHPDEDGKARIPSALAGSTLSFRAAGHAERIVREWSGQSIDVQLARRKEQ